MDKWRVIICYCNQGDFCCYIGPHALAQRVMQFTRKAMEDHSDTTLVTAVLLEKWEPSEPGMFDDVGYPDPCPNPSRSDLPVSMIGQ